MGKKSLAKQKNCGLSDEDNDVYNAVAIRPEVMAAHTLEKLVPQINFSGGERWQPNHLKLFEKLRDQTNALREGDLSSAENILLSQAFVLDRIFHNQVMQAMGEDRWEPLKNRMDFAFKAQRQCRATLETLATIKNPAPFIQNNRAQYQQVNNNAGADSARAENLEFTNKVLTHGSHDAKMDISATSDAGRGNPALAAVAAQHGAEI